MKLVTSLLAIEKNALDKTAENDSFINDLKLLSLKWVDEQVSNLNKTIEKEIDCTLCGNCCKTLMINVEEDETIVASNYLKQSIYDFKTNYIEQGMTDMMIINAIPCHFLANTSCSIYPARFKGCKEFPGLHLANVKTRMFTIMMHYNRCPIIYNVIEGLKVKIEEMNHNDKISVS